MARLARTNSVALAREAHALRDFGAIQIPPASHKDRQHLQESVDDYVWRSVRDVLARPDREALAAGETAALDDAAIKRIEAALDELILDIAPTLGHLLLFSDAVRNRVWAWIQEEENGSALLERFGRRLALGARAKQGAKLSVGPRERAFKETLKAELKTLQRLLRAGQRSANGGALLQDVRTVVQRQDNPFPGLLENWSSFEKLLTLKPVMLTALSAGRLTPALFVDEWVAMARNRSPESIRQALSQVHVRTRHSK